MRVWKLDNRGKSASLSVPGDRERANNEVLHCRYDEADGYSEKVSCADDNVCCGAVCQSGRDLRVEEIRRQPEEYDGPDNMRKDID